MTLYTPELGWTWSIVSPNNDTLYSRAWLDLEPQPIVLSLPKVPLTEDGKKVICRLVDTMIIATLLKAPTEHSIKDRGLVTKVLY